MTDKTTHTPQQLAHRNLRGNDRRVSGLIAPPPFQTSAGVVGTERRSPLDRRAEWLREYSLVVDDPT